MGIKLKRDGSNMYMYISWRNGAWEECPSSWTACKLMSRRNPNGLQNLLHLSSRSSGYVAGHVGSSLRDAELREATVLFSKRSHPNLVKSILNVS